MRTVNYLGEILEFYTGIWWWCDDDNITQFRGIPENIYSVAPYPTKGKKAKKNVMKGSDKIVSILYIKICYRIKKLSIRYGMLCW